MKLAIGNEKGGFGSSTLAVNVAAAFAAAGNTVQLIDTDRNSRSTSTWRARRRALALQPSPSVLTAPGNTKAALDDSAHHDVRIVDTWRYHEDIEGLAGCVDFWIAPTMVSRVDLDATLRTFELLRDRLGTHASNRIRFGALLTQTPTASGSREEGDARAYLTRRAPEMQVFRQALRSRVAWKETGVGRAVFELEHPGDGRALAEFTSFLAELATKLSGHEVTWPATGGFLVPRPASSNTT